jgi:hypothetical protein
LVPQITILANSENSAYSKHNGKAEQFLKTPESNQRVRLKSLERSKIMESFKAFYAMSNGIDTKYTKGSLWKSQIVAKVKNSDFKLMAK